MVMFIMGALFIYSVCITLLMWAALQFKCLECATKSDIEFAKQHIDNIIEQAKQKMREV